MSAAPRLRLAPESGVVARSDGGAFSVALARLTEAAEAQTAVVFALEGDDLLPYATDGAGSFRLGADDRRAIARPLVSRRVERADGLGCLPPGAGRALLVPLACGDEAVGVVVLGYREEPPDALGCAAEIELAGIAFTNELVRVGGEMDDRDLHELSRLASLGAFLVGVTHELRGPAGALALLVPEIVAALRGEKDPHEARALARD